MKNLERIGNIISNSIIRNIYSSPIHTFFPNKRDIFHSVNLYHLYNDCIGPGSLRIEDIRNKEYYHSKEVNDFINYIGNRDFYPQDIIDYDDMYLGKKATIMSLIERRSRIDVIPYSCSSLFPSKQSFAIQFNILNEDFGYFCRIAKLTKEDVEFFKTQLQYSPNPVSSRNYTICWIRYTVLDFYTLWIDDINSDIMNNIKNNEFIGDLSGLFKFVLTKFIQIAKEVYGKDIRIILPSLEIKRAFYKEGTDQIMSYGFHNEGFKISNTSSEGIELPGSMKSWKIWVLK